MKNEANSNNESSKNRLSNENGSIYKRADGRWAAVFSYVDDITGQKKRRCIYASTRDNAAIKLKASLDHFAK